jgi:hypothetical protein
MIARSKPETNICAMTPKWQRNGLDYCVKIGKAHCHVSWNIPADKLRNLHREMDYDVSIFVAGKLVFERIGYTNLMAAQTAAKREAMRIAGK